MTSNYRRTIATALLALVLLLAPNSAAADPVGPPNTDCPPGTTGDSDHYGGYCAASVCRSNKDCEGKRVCQPYALCVQEATYQHPRGNTHRAMAKGPCGKAKPCPASARCKVAKRCVPAGTPVADVTDETAPKPTPGGGAPQSQGCGSCSFGPTQLGSVGLGVLLVLVVWSRRRRG